MDYQVVAESRKEAEDRARQEGVERSKKEAEEERSRRKVCR